MSNEVQKIEPAILEQVMLEGDLTKLSPTQRSAYYVEVCDSMKLNPLTKPFDYLKLNNKLVLYANKNCAEQIRRNLGISLTLPEKKIEEGVYIVTARAEANGRIDEATGAVSLELLKGENRANAIMKAETKAKRRVTLSFAGLGMLDETEIESIPGAQKVTEKDITPKSDMDKAQAEFEAKNGIGQPVEKPPEPPKAPPPKPLTPEQSEKLARIKKMPDDVQQHFRAKKLTVPQIIKIMDDNMIEGCDDPEALRGWVAENPIDSRPAMVEQGEEGLPA
jgi:hypothetical protein